MKDIDMLFVVDGSGSIGDGNFEKIKQFLANVADTLSSNSRVAVVQFDSSAVTEISFGDKHNKTDLKGMLG